MYRKISYYLLLCLLIVCIATPSPAQELDLANNVELKRNPKLPPPALLYSDLLNALQSSAIWREGLLQINGEIRALFLPDYATNESIYSYNPDSGAKLAHVLKKTDGSVADMQFYRGQKHQAPYWKLHPGDIPEEPLAAGDYVMEWYLEGDQFYRFPLSVEVAESDDAYNPEVRYFINGPWSDYVYLYIPNETSTPMFSIWLRDKAASPGDWKEHQLNISVKRGGQEIAYWPNPNGGAHPVDLKPWWERLDMALDDPGNEVFYARDLKDGSYTVTVTLDEATYGEYAFSVKGGAIQHQERQVRESTNPLEYIEGGPERFFMKRKQ